MLFNFHKNHKEFLITIFVMYALLAILISVVPAFQVEAENGPLPEDQGMTAQERRGLAVYIANGCVTCHTQQVRNIEMDKMWGSRPSIPADYYYTKKRMNVWQQSPSLLGSERTGPDLSDVGNRMPAAAWQYTHLFNPRAAVPQSIMPAFPWLFEIKKQADSANDVIVRIPDDYREAKNIQGTIVATQKAQDLVAYLLSLKQQEIPNPEDFLPDPKSYGNKPESKSSGGSSVSSSNSGGSSVALPDGKPIFETECAICHQSSGMGVKGAFPQLKGSDIVNDDDASLHIKIVLEGYDSRPQYSVMPPFKGRLSDEEIAAVINYERTSWGNEGATVTAEEVAEIRKEME